MADKDNGYEIKEYNMEIYEYEPKNKKVEYYKKVEKTTTKEISNIVNTRSREYTSLTNKSYSRTNEYEKGNEHERGNSSISYQKSQGNMKGNRSFSSKQKYSYAGRVREKNNYVYYVSGIGYVNKNEDNNNK